jgi:hypothetical protein
MNFSYPTPIGDSSSRVHNKVTAGAQYVLTLNTGKINSQQLNEKLSNLKETKSNLEAENFDQIQSGAITGDILPTIGMSYFAELDMFNELLERSNNVRSVRMTSVGISSVNLDIGYTFGTPKTAEPGGLSIDVDRDVHSTRSVTGNQEKEKNHNMISSYLEGNIFEQIFSGQGISTVHILNYDNRNGMPFYTINQDNVDTVLSKLEYSEQKKQEFRILVNNGRELLCRKERLLLEIGQVLVIL